MKRIVYQITGQAVAVLIPGDCGLTLKQIGEKDVPVGVPFWIVDTTAIPIDRTLRDAWELDTTDMGNPNGTGGGLL